MALSKWLIICGFVLFILGLSMQFCPSLITWFGKLPGDIKIESGQTKVFIPATSMIILSVVFTILINILKR
jgi:hypothetical protein